jgi:lipoate-protein ligase B
MPADGGRRGCLTVGLAVADSSVRRLTSFAHIYSWSGIRNEHLAALGRRIRADVEYAGVDLNVGWDFSAWYQCGISPGMFEHRGTELVEGV